jgi:hypothetical protein
MSFRKRMAWLICSGFLAVVMSDHARAWAPADSTPERVAASSSHP